MDVFAVEVDLGDFGVAAGVAVDRIWIAIYNANIGSKSAGLTVLEQLRSGSMVSAHFRPDNSSALAFVRAPGFLGSRLRQWYGSFETDSDEDGEELLEELCEVPRLGFVSIAVDDGLDLDEEEITESNFPWRHWRLVLAAVRDDRGEWVARHGDAAR